MGWQIHSTYITAAILKGNELKHEIFLRPPPNVCSKEFVEFEMLHIYRFNDAPHTCYERIHAEFKRLGGVVSIYDNALFFWHDDNGMLIGILVSHTDNFAFARSQSFHTTVVDEEFTKTFKIKQHENSSLKYVGLGINQTKDGILVDQNKINSSDKTDTNT